MYLSADDARSDFFLAGALYVIGPSLFLLLADLAPRLLSNTPGLWFVNVIVPVLTAAAMPLYLLRYREESFASLVGGGVSALGTGLALSGVVIAGAGAGAVVSGGLAGGRLGVALTPLVLASLIARWGSLAVLVIFLYRRAEYAFRPISEQQATLVRQAGLATAGTVVVTTVLLLLDDRPFASLLVAAGVAGAYFLAERMLPQQGVGERWWVWAPVITLALGSVRIFSLFLGGSGFLSSAQQGAGVALYGVIVVMALRNRRGGLVAFGLSAGFLAASLLARVGATGFLL